MTIRGQLRDLACDPTCPQSPFDLVELSDADRAETHCANGGRCDKYGVVAGMGRHLSSTSWFTFSGAAGSRLPVRPPGARRCGTDWTSWLVSNHPKAGAPLANGTVCFQSVNTECAISIDVHVCVCKYDALTPTYAYKLPAARFCFLGYCGAAGPLPEPLSQPSCKPWCEQHKHAWEQKCSWVNACSGCLPCQYSGARLGYSVHSGAHGTATSHADKVLSVPPSALVAAPCRLSSSLPWRKARKPFQVSFSPGTTILSSVSRLGAPPPPRTRLAAPTQSPNSHHFGLGPRTPCACNAQELAHFAAELSKQLQMTVSQLCARPADLIPPVRSCAR